MVDAQEPNGDVPGVVPTSWHWDSDWAGPIWDAAIFLVPDLLYKYYADTGPYASIYETCKTYLRFLDSCRDQRGLLTKGLGDWLYYKSITPVDFMTSCYYYQDCKIMARMSKLLNKGDADFYLAKAADIKRSINQHFLIRIVSVMPIIHSCLMRCHCIWALFLKDMNKNWQLIWPMPFAK